ncbi:NAD synthase, ammonia-dependent [Natronomonas pharaonis DSM 2160]|uniref:NH(3)-dependent NAD(+) synthetase n=1 Tax=Natronomonas pharaonis (strain ATCC 35678 / DSM 2160 / CIP 103997 / JCM 8858 / NBRC 14720 / NCIMB 2260 / Gabara) TaxID=348780 RepID=A0A1U7EXT8_NATPD|nr:NAD+ synthase [Natronomonas pharaonis]CAI50005.1 NAD synthase, ammonia-dependent [Natronomonas pharaonis DSM 2160]
MTASEPTIEGTNVELLFSESELQRRRDHIVEFIEETIETAGADRAVLGLSGGIDSTTVAYLAVAALGPDRVHGISMPSSVNPDDDETDAERVANALDIEFDVIDINPIVDAFVDAAPDHAADDRMALGNVRVRTRAVLNYFVANAEDGLVLGTGNRSEAATGYFTKYGDQAVDCNPIGNLYKCQVRQLARELGVPEDLVSRTPTAAMWEGQTDEEEMGLGYDELDAILAVHVDGPLSKSATVRTLDVPESAVDRVVELYETSTHKRAMPPAPEPL